MYKFKLDVKAFIEAFLVFEVLYYVFIGVAIASPLLPDSYFKVIFDPVFIIINSSLAFFASFIRFEIYHIIKFRKTKPEGLCSRSRIFYGRCEQRGYFMSKI